MGAVGYSHVAQQHCKYCRIEEKYEDIFSVVEGMWS